VGWGGGAEIGGMRRDGDDGSDDGVTGKRGRKQKPIEARGPGVGRGGVISDVIEGVSLVGGVVEVEFGLEGGPKVQEGGRRQGRRGRSGVSWGFDKVEIPAEEGGNRGVSGEHGRDELGVESEIPPGFKIDVEDLEGGAITFDRGIQPELSPPTSDRWEGNVCAYVQLGNNGCIYDKCTGIIDARTIP
jgi:hypothetical protein